MKNFKVIILPKQKKCKSYFCKIANLVFFLIIFNKILIFFHFFRRFWRHLFVFQLFRCILIHLFVHFLCMIYSKRTLPHIFITNSSQKFSLFIFLRIFLTKPPVHTIIYYRLVQNQRRLYIIYVIKTKEVNICLMLFLIRF